MTLRIGKLDCLDGPLLLDSKPEHSAQELM
jgi:hypothetical protein